jgi:hypothetical protein
MIQFYGIRYWYFETPKFKNNIKWYYFYFLRVQIKMSKNNTVGDHILGKD